MTDHEKFIRGTVNEALSEGNGVARYGLLAAGFTPVDGRDLSGPEPPPGTYNGGIDARKLSRLQRGDLLFHFSDSQTKTTIEAQFAGAWWFDQECLGTIRSTAAMQNSTFKDTARSHLGVLYEWGDMGNLVGGRLNADFWCFRGLSGPINGKEQRISGSLRTDVVQIYVPGGLTFSDFFNRHDKVLTSGVV